MDLNLDEWSVEGFLIDRNPKKNNSVEEYLKVKKINIDDSTKNHFRGVLKNYLCNDVGVFILNLEEFNEFMSDDSREKNYHISKEELSNQIDYFDDLFIKLDEEEHDLAEENFSTYHTIILKFTKEQQEIFCFRKLSRVSAAGTRFAIHRGNVELLDKDYIYFDDKIDTIYFSNFNTEGETEENRKQLEQKILIFNRDNFSTLFRFNEYCIKTSRDFFNEFDFIEIADIEIDKKNSSGEKMKLKESFIEDSFLNKQITRIFSLSREEINIEKIKALKHEKGEKLKYKIQDDKVLIGAKDEVQDLLDLIDEKIANPLWNKEKDLRFNYKGSNL